MSRRVHRSPVQAILLTIGMSVFLLVAIASVPFGHIVVNRDWFGLALYSIIAVSSVVGIWFTVRMGVVIDPRGLQLRQLGRGRRLPWAAVDQVECGIYDVRLFFPLYAPIVTLTIEHSIQRTFLGLPVSKTKTAERVALTGLGSYRRTTAQRRTDELAAEISGHRQTLPDEPVSV